MTSDLYFIINVFNVIIISIDNFICALLYAIERVYRLLSLNPEYNHNHTILAQWSRDRLVLHVFAELHILVGYSEKFICASSTILWFYWLTSTRRYVNWYWDWWGRNLIIALQTITFKKSRGHHSRPWRTDLLLLLISRAHERV